MNYLIVGAGVAGISAVKEIMKNRNKGDKITVITDENYPFYYRPRLIECLSGEVNVEDIIIHDRNWFKENEIDLRTGERAEKVDFKVQVLITDKNEYNYDKLLLANGAHSFVPPFKGVDQENIFTLRDAADARLIKKEAEDLQKAVIVGSGLLGIESGFQLSKSGLEVTLLERSDHLLSRQLDKRGGQVLQEKLEKRGLQFFLNAETKGFERLENGQIKVLLSDRELFTDMVLISTGVRSNIGIFKETELEIERAVVVNKYMETNIEDVYAAGDICEYNGNFYGIWPPSMKQGAVAGGNMAGKKREFSGYVPSHKLKIAGIDVRSVGDLDRENKLNQEVKELSDKYRKLIKNEKGELVGAIYVGDFSDKDNVIAKIKS